MLNTSILEAVTGTNLEDKEIVYNEKLYLLLRQLYLQTRGEHNLRINKYLSRSRPITSTVNSTHDGLIDHSLLDTAIKSLFDTGYFVTRLTLPTYNYLDLVNSIKHYGNNSAASSSARLFLDSWKILKKSDLVSKIVYDTSIKYIADRYLRCDSIVNSIKAWNTTYRDKVNHNISGDAMQFHFDSDHNRFLKIFVYLDDVNSQNGPHVYVPRTNMFYRSTLPSELNVDARIPDLTLLNFGLIPHALTGCRGTIIFADTHNLHRGSAVKVGHERNILQVQYVDSLFGAKPQHSMAEIQEMNSIEGSFCMSNKIATTAYSIDSFLLTFI